jgi:hypothetical protein
LKNLFNEEEENKNEKEEEFIDHNIFADFEFE